MAKANFRFWVPLTTIEKAKDANGVETMKLGGIASTKSRDTDDEVLEPGGFDLSYLRSRGVCNWNHEKGPESVIGEPTSAFVNKEGLYVETMLYPDSAKAQHVYKLAETLQKSKATRRLGFSVEGKATERDPLDPNHVTGAKITGIALTISPKNPDSIVDIIKGNYAGWDDTEAPPVDDVVPGFEAATGGQQYLIDITRPDGIRVTVDQNYNVQVHKAMTTDSSSGRAVMHEHVDGETKDQMNSNLTTKVPVPIQKSETETDQDEQGLTQEEVIKKILSTDSVISFEKANEIYNVLNDLTMATKTKITDDLLDKSLEKLDLKKSSNVNDDENERKKNRNKETKAPGEIEDTIDFSDEDIINDGVEPKAKKKRPDPVKIGKAVDDEDVKKGKDDDDDDDDDEDEAPKKKFKKAVTATFSKAKKNYTEETDDDDEGPDIKRPAKFDKGGLDEVIDMVKSLAIITKAGYDIQKSNEDRLSAMEEQIAEFAERPVSQGRKSMSKGVERDFQKSMGGRDLEKSEDGRLVVDVNRARAAVLNMFDTMTFKNNQMNPEMAKAMQLFEAAGEIQPSIQKSLENEFNVKLVKRIGAN